MKSDPAFANLNFQLKVRGTLARTVMTSGVYYTNVPKECLWGQTSYLHTQ